MVTLSDRFKADFSKIYAFIARDNKNAARKFRNELIAKLYTLEDNPYRCRRLISFNDDNVRDFIFKGYTTPYLIDGNIILILGIYGANEWQA